MTIALVIMSALVAVTVPRYISFRREIRERIKVLNRKIDKVDEAFSAWMQLAGVQPQVTDNGKTRR